MPTGSLWTSVGSMAWNRDLRSPMLGNDGQRSFSLCARIAERPRNTSTKTCNRVSKRSKRKRVPRTPVADTTQHPWFFSTPMIKTELVHTLKMLAPEKKWTKSHRLKDYVEFTVNRFDPATTDPQELRALQLAHVLHDAQRG